MKINVEENKNIKVQHIALILGFIIIFSVVVFLGYNHFDNKNVITVKSKAITDWSKLDKDGLNRVSLKFDVEMNPLEIASFDYVLSDDIDNELIKHINIGILNYEKSSEISELVVGIRYDKLEKDLYKYLIENPDAVRVTIASKNGSDNLISSTKVNFDPNKIADSMPDF